MKINFLSLFRRKIIFPVCLFAAPAVYASDYNIKAYGAIADGKTITTLPIQKAINDCSLNGGGRVIVPSGKYLCGTLMLKDNVELFLEAGAVICGSTNAKDYATIDGQETLIGALGISNAAITGLGEINGNGNFFVQKDNATHRPMIAFLKNSKHITLSGINLKSSAFWTLHLLYNDGVSIDNVHIYSHSNFNNDGIDIDSKNVTISNCIIDTDDDGICFKSDSSYVCENVTVSNCVIASNCNFLKMGTASVGGFKNISITNCSLHKASESNFRFWNKKNIGVTDYICGIAGIALEVVDGGIMDGITISNITMQGVQTPLFIRLGNRANATGVLKNIVISNIIAKAVSPIPSSITAIPGFYTENIVLSNILIESKGEIVPASNTAVPEKEKSYPENRMFEVPLPAYGLYVRHAKGLTLNNIRFNTTGNSNRSALYLEDAENVHITQLQAAHSKNTSPVISIDQSKNVMISNYMAEEKTPLFLHVKGNKTNNVVLLNNDFSNVESVYSTDTSTTKNVVKIK